MAVPTASAETRAVDVFLQYLRAEGVRHVFGIPGGLSYPFFEAVERAADLELVVAKHEQGAAFMADGYARQSGRLAVCAGTGGPGSTNLLTGVACAYADGVPLLVVTGQAARDALGTGAARETPREDIDIVAMFAPITKYSAMVTSPETLSHHLRRALRRALTGRPGPVHLNVPVDLWERRLGETWYAPRTYRPVTHAVDRASVAVAGDALLDAQRPVLLVGAGVAIARAHDEVRALAALVDARVATTPRAKGVFPEDDPRSLGVFGIAGHVAARETLLGGRVDVLAALGASLDETTTFDGNSALQPARSLIQLDIDPDRIGRTNPVDVALVGDARAILGELVTYVRHAIERGRAPRSQWAAEPPPPRGDARYEDPALRSSDAVPLTPQRWRAELREVLPENAVVYSDIGGHMLFNLHHLEVRAGQSFVLNLGFGSMGHGTVAPIGAALAAPDRPVIAIVGDACFTMNGMELLTAAEYDVPVIWIVENDYMHGVTWHGRAAIGSCPESIRYRRRVDIAPLAAAMGLPVSLVGRPGTIKRALAEALARKGPSVIEVLVDGRSCSLAGFIRR